MGELLYFTSMANLPNRIRELRKARQWPLERLALALDCSIPQIAEMERGLRTLSYDWMVKIAGVLQVNVSDLLLDHDIPDRLSPEEAAIVARFRDALPEQQVQLRALADVIVPFRPQPRDEEDRAA